eukprot:jgi/Bigna1/68822/fgenesh1_pg.7_\
MVELAEAEKRLAKARELQKYRGESHSADRNELESFKRLVAELNLKLACNRAKVDQLEFEIGNYKDRIASYKRRYASASSFSSLEGGGEELEEDRNEGHGEQHLGDDDCPGGRSLGDQAGGDNQHEHKVILSGDSHVRGKHPNPKEGGLEDGNARPTTAFVWLDTYTIFAKF